MSENVNLSVPDFLDIDPDTAAAAEATLKGFDPVAVPDTAKASVGKNGETYYRWTEAGVIESAWRESGKTPGMLVPTVQIRFRVGSPNGGRRFWARHTLHIPTMGGSRENAGYIQMNDRSIAAITTLLRSTGYMPTEGTVTKKLLEYLFPLKNAPGATTPLKGKTVIVNMSNSPNAKATKEEYKRQSGADSYLTDTPTEE